MSAAFTMPASRLAMRLICLADSPSVARMATSDFCASDVATANSALAATSTTPSLSIEMQALPLVHHARTTSSPSSAKKRLSNATYSGRDTGPSGIAMLSGSPPA